MNYAEAAKATLLAGLEDDLRAIQFRLQDAGGKMAMLKALVSAGPSSPSQDRAASPAPESPCPETLSPAPGGQARVSPLSRVSSRRPKLQGQSGCVQGSPSSKPARNKATVKKEVAR